ncbi:MAG: hypothetical protein SVO01_01170 [Thermotogota bacterium]|nr:hypothetical protein [Thermotogota bacterium]
MDDSIFIAIFGHGRSGTTLCAGLLNQSLEVNIGLEVNNQSLMDDKYKRPQFETLSKIYNGNKVAMLPNMNADAVISCLDNRNWIFRPNIGNLKVVFVHRDPVETIVSQRMRQRGKGKGKLSLKEQVERYKVAEFELRKLKRYFISNVGFYHRFEFNNAIKCERHIKDLFEYVGVPYSPLYRENFKGEGQYNYGGMAERMVMFGTSKDPEIVEMKSQIWNIFSEIHFWPDAGADI